MSEPDIPGDRDDQTAARARPGGAGAAPEPPYGPPILDAVARGDLHEMKAVAEAARKALYQVEFSPVTEENADEVRVALHRLEEAIRRLERPGPEAEQNT